MICRSNAQSNFLQVTVLLVDPETLNFIENPDIALIPQTSDDYLRESAELSQLQLQTLLSPKGLSPLQEKMLSHHNHLHHMPFPKLIVMARQGVIPKPLASLKGRCPLCVACLFGQAHKRPWQSKSKQKHPICKPTDNAPGKRALMDQIVFCSACTSTVNEWTSYQFKDNGCHSVC